jgi:RimJ/RimL family protein N-acetyltransferase
MASRQDTCINIAYWGRGYASEAFAAFLNLYWTLEERRDVTTLVGKVDPDNVPSARVMQKSGAKSGERLKGGWKRKGEDGKEEERDFVCWILERPGMEEKSHGGEREKGLDTTSN